MNKNVILLSLLLFIFLQNAIGQMEIGVKGGYTYSWPGYGEIELPEGAETNVSGYNLGLFWGIGVYDDWGIRIEPTFIKRGAACFPGWQPVFEGDSKVFLNYFESPVLIQKQFHFSSISITPSFGYGLSLLNKATVHQELLSEDQILVSNIEVGTDADDSFNRLDHGFYVSLRIQKLILEQHFLFLESSYYHGMKDYDKQNVSLNRNLNINVGLGYLL